jgi:diguanylate cyclase (GGDEF)-like protein
MKLGPIATAGIELEPSEAGEPDGARPPRRETLSVLLACNAAAERDRIAAMLMRGRRNAYALDWHSGYGAALRAIEERRHDVVLVDMALDNGLGANLLRELAEDPQAAPAILFGVTSGSGIESWAMGAGAADCLVDGELTPAVLDRALSFAHESRRADQRYRYLSRFDPDTGLANRTSFRGIVERTVGQARRHDHMLAVVLVGLDSFKFALETVGHAASDRLLRAVVERVRAFVPSDHTLARLGDDRFSFIIEDLAAIDDAEPIAARLTQAMAEPFEIDGHDVFVSVSVGIATYPICGWDADTLVTSAATAMSRARMQGHNCYQFYTRKMTTQELQRLVLQTSLHRALERRELVLHYQPQIDLRTGLVTGAEALVRWRHRDFGLLGPTEFIPVAEETGLIVPLGRWVLAQACHQVRAWENAGLPPLRLAVNVAQRQFRAAAFPDVVAEALEESSLAADRLNLEITEGTLMDDTEASHAMLARLRDMGVGVSIDDFGTGYSSLGYLKRFPLDTLKIDKSFVSDVPHDPEDSAITEAVIGLAHNLRLNVIAEGVETKTQLAFLKDRGCDAIQGHVFSEPVAPEAFAERFRQNRVRIGAA